MIMTLGDQTTQSVLYKNFVNSYIFIFLLIDVINLS